MASIGQSAIKLFSKCFTYQETDHRILGSSSKIIIGTSLLALAALVVYSKYYFQNPDKPNPTLKKTPSMSPVRVIKSHQVNEKKQMQNFTYNICLDFPSPLPSPVVPELATKWIEAHPSNLQNLAAKVIQNLQYIPHKNFLKSLEASIQSFNKKNQDRDFVIVIPEGCRSRSNHWVTSLSLSYFDRPPVDIISDQQVEQFLSHNKNVKEAVFLDDAAYSGKQMYKFIYSARGMEKINLNLIIPFMTKNGFQKLRSSVQWISTYVQMKTIRDLFEEETLSREEMNIISNSHQFYDSLLSGEEMVTLTWFDHTIADNLSTLDSILKDGYSLHTDATERVPRTFIVTPFSPYNPTMQKILLRSKKVMEQRYVLNQVGPMLLRMPLGS